MHDTDENWHLHGQRVLVDLVTVIHLLSHGQRPVLSDIAAELIGQFCEDGDRRLCPGQVKKLGQAGEYRSLLSLLTVALCSILFRLLSGSLFLAHRWRAAAGCQPGVTPLDLPAAMFACSPVPLQTPDQGQHSTA